MNNTPFFQHAGDWTIDGYSVNTFLDTLSIEEDPSKYIELLNEKLNLYSIHIDTEEIITEAMFLEIITGKTKATVKNLGTKVDWTNVILRYGNAIIEVYVEQFKKFRNADLPAYLEKLDILYRTIDNLSEIRNAVFLGNRFFFAAHTSFYVEVHNTEMKNHKSPVMFNMLSFTESKSNELREIFQIRFELFDALLVKTRQFLHALQSDQYKYSSFKLDQKKGKYLILEFAAALTAKGSFLKLSEDQTERNKQMNHLHRSLFDLFGLEHVSFPKVLSEIYRKEENKAQYLVELIKKFSPLSYDQLQSEKKEL